jgi:GrpB-like predicted nucleotidyltransferase (UPF0157 family)
MQDAVVEHEAVKASRTEALADVLAGSRWPGRAGGGASAYASGTSVAAFADEVIALSLYHPSWPARYRVEAEVLRVALAGLAPHLEHIGSTAVPGLAAKPIVDILVGIERPAEIDAHTERLANFGYRTIGGSEYSERDQRFLVRTVRGMRTHHVHVVEHMNDAWHRLLLFRDVLRIDPQLALEYEQLKRELAAKFPTSRLGYTAGKSDFIKSVIGVTV